MADKKDKTQETKGGDQKKAAAKAPKAAAKSKAPAASKKEAAPAEGAKKSAPEKMMCPLESARKYSCPKKENFSWI